jgi:hypothetical protein
MDKSDSMFNFDSDCCAEDEARDWDYKEDLQPSSWGVPYKDEIELDGAGMKSVRAHMHTIIHPLGCIQ